MRLRAEEIATAQARIQPENTGELSPARARSLLRELRVHQIELELQNESLRASEHAHERARARYADLFDQAPVGYLCVDDGGKVVDANQIACELLDTDAQTLLRAPFTRLIASEDQDEWYLCRQRLLRDRGTQHCELRMVAPNTASREPLWVRLDIVERRAGLSMVTRVAVTDIDEQRRQAEALRRSEARFRALFQCSTDALLIVQPPDWRVREANAAAGRLFGARTEAELAALTLWDHDADTRSGRVEHREEGLPAEPRQYTWTLSRVDGARFRASVAVSPVDVDGSPLLLVAVRDQTAYEAERAALAQTDRIASMGMLAANVAHEINTPLTYQLMLSENLAESLPLVADAAHSAIHELERALGDERAHEQLGRGYAQLQPAHLGELCEQARACVDATQRIRNIATALGTFARVDDEGVRPVELSRAIASAVEMSCNEVRHRAGLVQDLDDSLRVLGSEGQLSQVFLNLLVNAARSIEPGAVAEHEVAIRTWREGGDAFAEVRDDGVGIPAEQLTRVFEPFFSTRPRGSGTGLGLTICRDIVEGHGGSISLESSVDVALGRGTVVRVKLPAHAWPERAPEKPSTGQRTLAARGKLLIVDDEPAILAVLSRLFGTRHEVTTASSGLEAQRILERDGSFDLILCDLMMPMVGGTELHDWIRGRDSRLAGRMLFMTGGVFTSEATQYIERHGLRVLQKPFDRPELTELVSELIRDARRRAQA